MPLRKLADEAGDTIDVLEVNGFYIANLPVPNFEQEMESMKTWKARDDDVLLCAYPKSVVVTLPSPAIPALPAGCIFLPCGKSNSPADEAVPCSNKCFVSGTHWIWEMAYLLLNNKEELSQATKAIAMMEDLHQERFDAMESPRMLNTHLHPDFLPRDLFDRRCKLVFVFRNPKDVAVSFYNHHYNLSELYHYNGSWPNYLPMFISGNVDFGSYFDFAEVWERFMRENPDYPVHLMYYEDVIKDGHGELTKLANFLEVNEDPLYLEKVKNVCCFDNMKKEKQTRLELLRDRKISIYRKGKVGDWKNWFTVAQNELFDEVINKKAKILNLKMQFEI